MAFPPEKETRPVEGLLIGSVAVLGTAFTASTLLQFLFGANPYFANVDPNQGNVSWLSRGSTRVHGNAQCKQHAGAGRAECSGPMVSMALTPTFRTLLAYLNANFSNPAGVDPFGAASNVIAQLTGAYTGHSSVTPSTNSHNNYNFAVARVRMRGPQGPAGEAQNARVFFRL